jgi:pheromone shutdown protein TraB
VTFKTKKDIEFKVAYDATKEHPAQVVPVDITVNVGKFTTKKWSGKLSSLEKAKILTRLDALIKATKRARMRANEVKVDTNAKIGEKLLNYIHRG